MKPKRIGFRDRRVIEYENRIRELLSKATWLNDTGSFIPPQEISDYLCRARVGLALSAEEGPMAACVEYLLSGLPVVSTPSLGGRDVFFDERFVKVVEPDPHAVSEGVEALARLQIDPQVSEKCEYVILLIKNHARTKVCLNQAG